MIKKKENIILDRMDIVLATRNVKKAQELQRILGDTSFRILTLDSFPDCPEVIEDKDSFEGNALKKATTVAKHTGLVAIADDSGLEVDALDGRPGVISAYYAGMEASDAENIAKLLFELKGVPAEKRTARFVCCIAIAFPDGQKETFFGYVYGKIAEEPKGRSGFGYDPIFYPLGQEKTFAEMSADQKDSISHRKQALLKLKNYLRKYLNKQRDNT
ncbi:MAG: XTP/dITP diphosphatase [Thermodesulfovibrionales bacterium]|nr:XTP/dITP diphosphatase [Thermodesulfovibrionales bacterium]